MRTRDMWGRTPLHTVAKLQSDHAPQLMRLLLQKSDHTDVNLCDEEGHTALQLALHNHHRAAPRVVRLLLDNGAVDHRPVADPIVEDEIDEEELFRDQSVEDQLLEDQLFGDQLDDD